MADISPDMEGRLYNVSELQLEMNSSEDESFENGYERSSFVRRAALLSVFCGVALAVVAFWSSHTSSLDSAKLSGTVELERDPTLSGSEMEFFKDVVGMPGIPGELSYKRLQYPQGIPTSTTTTTLNPAEAAKEALEKLTHIKAPAALRATENSPDCNNGEELFEGLCYKQCAVLTLGVRKIRSGPNTCCLKEPCLFPSDLDFSGPFICQGYAVDNSNHCPRSPGKCKANEELYMGTCYKTCDLLTKSTHPHRAGPNSCCTTAPPCFNVFHIKTEGMQCTGYDVGGDTDKSGKPVCAHKPSVPIPLEQGTSATTSTTVVAR
eukprot:TRINITY_DN68056_c0_g1_i1.p1 TRINITY_DN68056_c0_g1~~TRINITY_DN68056_c0_g1_i1.p1  ORF type:complete len:333 (+),score=48.42 TRINITY_DN68056_c0_g1_i1:39-1001(+)